jgi:hypothetical protein
MMDAVGTSETLAYSSETIWPYISKGSHLHTRRREKLKSHRFYIVFSFNFPLKLWVHFTYIPHMAHEPPNPSPILDNQVIFGEEWKL